MACPMRGKPSADETRAGSSRGGGNRLQWRGTARENPCATSSIRTDPAFRGRGQGRLREGTALILSGTLSDGCIALARTKPCTARTHLNVTRSRARRRQGPACEAAFAGRWCAGARRRASRPRLRPVGDRRDVRRGTGPGAAPGGARRTVEPRFFGVGQPQRPPS
jgi:hypothetical protein